MTLAEKKNDVEYNAKEAGSLDEAVTEFQFRRRLMVRVDTRCLRSHRTKLGGSLDG